MRFRWALFVFGAVLGAGIAAALPIPPRPSVIRSAATKSGDAAIVGTRQPTYTQPATIPDNPPAGIVEHVIAATDYLERLPEDERVYVRFLSFYSAPAKHLSNWSRFLAWWVNQMSWVRTHSIPIAVPGTRNRLWAIHLRDYDWNPEAWESVAQREPFFREPWVPPYLAIPARKLIGAGHVNQQKTDTRPLVVVVSATWFMRETLETNKSPSYYDLLFARFRFLKGGTREILVEERESYLDYQVLRTFAHPGGRYVHPTGHVTENLPKGQYTEPTKRERVTKKAVQVDGPKFVDFPANVADWEKAFGLDGVKKTQARGIDLDMGALVEGGRDKRETGSQVSLNNRLVVVLEGPFGPALATLDVKETLGVRDYNDALIFANKPFKPGTGAQAVADAQELLAYLPNGGQAALLVDGQGKRVELAASEVAMDRVDTCNNAGVRIPGSCVQCHANSNGFIKPSKHFEELLAKGIKFKADPKRLQNGLTPKDFENRLLSFFTDWHVRIDGWTQPYKQLIDKTTAVDGAEPWTGANISTTFAQFRDWYDGEVSPEQAAIEMGVTTQIWQRAIEFAYAASPSTRIKQLQQGMTIPRVTWDGKANVADKVGTSTTVGLLMSTRMVDPLFGTLGLEKSTK